MNNGKYTCTCFTPTAPLAPVRVLTSQHAQTANAPLKTPPVWHSNPGAKYTLWLNFGGGTVVGWDAGKAIPPLDIDKLPDFSSLEVALMSIAYRVVAEDYAPFNIDVTTEKPADLSPGKTLIAAIGGSGVARGMALIGGFWLTGGNVVEICPNTSFLLVVDPTRGIDAYTVACFYRFLGDVVSHEAGHAFGLLHQFKFDAAGKLVPFQASDNYHAPLMGNSYGTARGIWWNGTGHDGKPQNDFAVLSTALGLRSKVLSTPEQTYEMLVPGVYDGLIRTPTETDWWRFEAGAGPLEFVVTVPEDFVGNLLPRVKLYRGSSLVDEWTASLATPTGIATGSARLAQTVTLVGPDTYYLVVSGDGDVGSVGSYKLSVKFPPYELPLPSWEQAGPGVLADLKALKARAGL